MNQNWMRNKSQDRAAWKEGENVRTTKKWTKSLHPLGRLLVQKSLRLLDFHSPATDAL